MSNPTAHENAASTATATAPSQPPLKRKAEFDREDPMSKSDMMALVNDFIANFECRG